MLPHDYRERHAKRGKFSAETIVDQGQHPCHLPHEHVQPYERNRPPLYTVTFTLFHFPLTFHFELILCIRRRLIAREKSLHYVEQIRKHRVFVLDVWSINLPG